MPANRRKRCATCGNPNTYRNLSACRSCINANNDRFKKLQVRPGKCSACKSQNNAPGLKSCGRCLDIGRRQKARSRENKKCSRCNVRDTTPGFKSCQRCREQQRQRRNNLVSDGKCRRCYQEHALRGKCCQTCLNTETRLRKLRKEKKAIPLVDTESIDSTPVEKCSYCNTRDVIPGLKSCETCRKRPHNRRGKNAMPLLMGTAKCSHCRVRDRGRGKRLCSICSVERPRQASSKRRREAKENGKCSLCCKNVAHPSRSLCHRCLTRMRQRSGAKALQLSLDNKCTRCGKNTPRLGIKWCSS